MKPNKDYRMSKSAKRTLANFTDAHQRGNWKRMLIDAELSEKEARQAKLKDKFKNLGDE